MIDALKERIRHVPDFPKPGILFYDVTTLLKDSVGFQLAVDAMTAPHRGLPVDVVVGIESRGFIFGAAVADRLKSGFAPVRKLGKLPSKTRRASYALEYGTDSLEIHEDAIQPGAKCSWSMTCWRRAARRRPRSASCGSLAPMSSACSF